MFKKCPNCGDSSSYQKFCDQCGVEMIPVPRCNWCLEEISDRMKFCTKCGKSRHEALTTYPPSPLEKVKKFINWLLDALDDIIFD